MIAPGVHPNFSVIPKPADRFFSRAGAILDGGHLTTSAFHVTPAMVANDVLITGAGSGDLLVVRNYGHDPLSQVGAIQPSVGRQLTGAQRASGWSVQWVEVTGDASRGISLANAMTIDHCLIDGNGRLGIGGGGTAATIAEDVISGNGASADKPGFEAGGIKTIGVGIVIDHDHIVGNGAAGVWTDGGATGVRITNSDVMGNQVGIHIEISQDVTISGNTISDNSMQAVLVVASHHVLISRNSVTANRAGIIVGGVLRAGPNGIRLGEVAVLANDVTNSGVSGLTQPLAAGMNVLFNVDHYVNARFTWEGHRVTFAQWQSEGQERNGSAR